MEKNNSLLASLVKFDILFLRIWQQREEGQIANFSYHSAIVFFNSYFSKFYLLPKARNPLQQQSRPEGLLSIKMTAPRRLRKELTDLQECGLKSFRDIATDDDNLLRWTGLIVPDNPPYNKGAFRIEINFPAEYPFKPPKILFKTKIYHPNIDEKGQVCLPIISTENWKPATRTDQVINALIALINDPEPEHPLRADLAEEFLKDRKKFMKNAEDYSRKNSEKRPAD